MKTVIYTIILPFLLSFAGIAQKADWIKAEPYSSFITQDIKVIHDKFGNTFTAGGSRTPKAIFIIKYDKNGNKLWSKFYASQYGGDMYSLATDSTGNLYVSMFTPEVEGNSYAYNSGYLFAKYDVNGNLVWIKKNTYFIAFSEFTDKDNNLVVTGNTNKTAQLNANTLITIPEPYMSSQSFIAKFNTEGECVWALVNEDDGSGRIFQNSTPDIFITGFISSGVTLGKGTKKVTYNNPNKGNTFIAKYDKDGNLIWSNQAWAGMACADKFGNLYSFESDIYSQKNAYIVKYNANGKILWKRSHIYIEDGYKAAMKSGENGDLFISSGFNKNMSINDTSFYAKGYQLFTVKLDSAGNFKWLVKSETTGFGGAGAKDMVVYGNEIYVTGDSWGDITFGGQNLSQSNKSVFTVKITDNDKLAVSVPNQPYLTDNDFEIYPNPTTNNFNLSYSNTKATGELKIRIATIQGQIIYNETISDFNGNLNKQISLGNIAKGIYLIELNSQSFHEVKKVIIE